MRLSAVYIGNFDEGTSHEAFPVLKASRPWAPTTDTVKNANTDKSVNRSPTSAELAFRIRTCREGH